MIDIFIARTIGLTVPCKIILSYSSYEFTICPYDNPRINALWSDIYRNRQEYADGDQLPDLTIERGMGCQSYILCEIDADELPENGDVLDSFKKIVNPILLYFQFLFAGKFYIDRIILFKPQEYGHIPYRINLYPSQGLLIAEDPLLFERDSDSIEPNLIKGIEKNFNEFYDSIQKHPFYLNLIQEYLDAIITKDSKLRLGYMWNCFEHMVHIFMKKQSNVIVIQDEIYQKLIRTVRDKLTKELSDADIVYEGLQTEQILYSIEQELFKIRKKAKGIPKSKIKEIRQEIRKIIEEFPKEPPLLSKEQAIELIKSRFNNYPPILLQIEKTFNFFTQNIGDEDEEDFLYSWDYEMILRKPGPILDGYGFKVSEIIKKVRIFRNGLFHRGEVIVDDFEIDQLTKSFKIISVQLLLNLFRYIKPFKIMDYGLIWNTPEATYKSVEDTIIQKLNYAMRVETGPIVETRIFLEDIEKKIFMKKGLEFQRSRDNEYLFGTPLVGEILKYNKKNVVISLKDDFEGIVRILEGRLVFFNENYFRWKSTIKLKTLHENETNWIIFLNISKRRLSSLIAGKFCKFKTNKITLIVLN